jgi:phosphatidylglycerophosphate synthase
MIRELRFVPNQLTAARLVLLPVLWIYALRGDSLAVGVGLAVAFVLDFGDGFVARRLGQTSAFGSKFDSAVDALIGPSAICWLLLLQPQTVLDHILLLTVWAGVTYGSLALGLFKFRRLANLHLQSSRIACVVQYAFLVDAFAAPPYQPALLYAAAAMGIVSSLETLTLQLTSSRVDEHVFSLVPAPRRTRA